MSSPLYPEILLDAGEMMAKRLEHLGLSPEQASLEAFQLTEYLREHWGGQDIYIPKGNAFELSRKYQRIYEAWRAEGFTPDVARREGLSMQRIRQIVHAQRLERRQKVHATPLLEELA